MGSFFFFACNQCDCIDENLRPNFIAFAPAEVDTIVIKRYAKDNRFAAVIDTSLITNPDYVMQQRGDTITFPIRTGDFTLNPNFDYVIQLPAASRSFQISEIDNEQIRDDCSGKVQCINPIRSLKINGTWQPLKETVFQFYLRK